MSKLHEVRSLMNEALRVANDIDQDVRSELHLGLEHIRGLLDCAIKSMDSARDTQPVWPSLAARA
jgi:hypothetical protein